MFQKRYNNNGDIMDTFKPFKNEKTVISIRIDRQMLTVIDDLASETDISRNEMIIQCINFALVNTKKEELEV